MCVAVHRGQPHISFPEKVDANKQSTKPTRKQAVLSLDYRLWEVGVSSGGTSGCHAPKWGGSGCHAPKGCDYPTTRSIVIYVIVFVWLCNGGAVTVSKS